MRSLILLLLAGLCAAEESDRKIAEWTLSMGGRVRLQGSTKRLQDVSQLPAGDFRVEVLDWVGMNVDPPDLERLTGLRALKELHLPGPLWSRNADGGRDGSRDLKYLSPVSTLEVLTFSYHFLDSIRFRDAGLEEIKGLTGLRELVLRQTAVRGAALAPFTNLRFLDLTLSPLNDAGAANLAGMTKLQRLRIGDTEVTDAGLAVLAKLTELEELDVHGTALSDDGLRHLAGLTKLKKLNLMGTAVTDAGMPSLAGLTNLEEINLYRTKVSNAGLEPLRRMKKLVEADLRYSRVTQGGIDALRAALPSVTLLYNQQAARAATKAPVGSGLAEWVRSLGGKAVLEGGAIVEVSLAQTPVTDAQLARLAEATALRKLNLEATELGDAGMKQVARLASLEELNISSTSVSDTGLAELAPLKKMRRLTMANTYIEGAGLEAVQGLEQLDAHGSPLVNSAVVLLGRMRGLRWLSLAQTDISDGVPLDVLKTVTHLDLAGTDLTDAGLKPVASLTQLHELILREARLTDAGLEHLKPLVNLRSLDLIRTRLSDKGMASLAALTGLKSLRLDYAELYDKGFDPLTALAGIEELSLDSTHITDQSIEKLKQYRNLKSLNLYHTLVTEAGMKVLKTALPECKIIWDKDSALPNRRRA